MGSAKSCEYLRFLGALQHPDTMAHAHNALFERLITAHVLTRMEPQIRRVPTISQYRCSMLRAYMCGLPGSLGECGAATGVAIQKDREGQRLMMKMCKPDAVTGLFEDSPEMRIRLAQYCETDVAAEDAIEEVLPEIPASEIPLVELTERINDYGMKIDIESALSAQIVMGQYEKELDARCRKLTGGASGRQVGAILKSLSDRGVELENLTKKQVADILKTDDMDPVAREILELRQESAKASTAKIGRMLQMTDSKSRVRGSLVYHGCHTGRYSARGIQPQNLPRPTIKNVNPIFECLPMRDLELLKILYSSPAEAMSSAIRGLIHASPGKSFLRADFSAIEARVLAFLAKDKNLMESYRKGVDVYKIMAGKIYSTTPDRVTEEQRQLGKQAILAAGYGLGAKGFVIACAGYGIEIDFDPAQRVIDIYRDSHPDIVYLWKRLEGLCLEAVGKTGTAYQTHGMYAKVEGNFLLLKLISGRKLWFYKPYLKEKKAPWGEMKTVVHYTGSYMGKPSSEHLYGGSITAMATQATARDMMTHAMLNLDKAGFPIVLTVHDEIVAEDQKDRLAEFVNIMETPPKWATGFPLKVDAWCRQRYGK
jgi:DNA polymerase